MASKKEDDMIALVGLLVVMKCKKKWKHKAWCKDWLTKRNEYTHTRLLRVNFRSYRLLKLFADEWRSLLKTVVTCISTNTKEKYSYENFYFSPWKTDNYFEVSCNGSIIQMTQVLYYNITPSSWQNNSGDMWSHLQCIE